MLCLRFLSSKMGVTSVIYFTGLWRLSGADTVRSLRKCLAHFQ